MQQRFSFFQAFVLSFHSRQLYRDVHTNWHRSGLFYTLQMAVLIVVILTVFSLFIVSKIQIDTPLRNFSTWVLGHNDSDREIAINRTLTLLSTLPRMEYQNGELTTKEPMSVIIHDTETRNALLTINTTDDPSIVIPYRHNAPYITLTRHSIALDNQYIAFPTLADEYTIKTILTVINQFPPLTLLGGHLISSGTDPFVITKYNSTDPLLIIDTTGKQTHLDQDSTAFALLTADTVSFSLPSLKKHTITQMRWDELDSDAFYKLLHRLFSAFRYLLILAIFVVTPLFTLLIFSVLAVIVLFYSLFGYLLTRCVPHMTSLTYRHCIKLSAVSLTPPLLLCLLIRPETLLQAVLYGLFAMGYVWFGLYSAKSAQT